MNRNRVWADSPIGWDFGANWDRKRNYMISSIMITKEEKETLPYRIHYEQDPKTKKYSLFSVDKRAIELVQMEHNDLFFEWDENLECKKVVTKKLPRDIVVDDLELVVFYPGKDARRPCPKDKKDLLIEICKRLDKINAEQAVLKSTEDDIKTLHIRPLITEYGIQCLPGRPEHRKIYVDLGDGNDLGRVVAVRSLVTFDWGDISNLEDIVDDFPDCEDVFRSCIEKVGFVSNDKIAKALENASSDLQDAIEECLVEKQVYRRYVNKNVLKEKLAEHPELKEIFREAYTESEEIKSDERFEEIYPGLPRAVKNRMETLEFSIQVHPKTNRKKTNVDCEHCGGIFKQGTNVCNSCGNVTLRTVEEDDDGNAVAPARSQRKPRTPKGNAKKVAANRPKSKTGSGKESKK